MAAQSQSPNGLQHRKNKYKYTTPPWKDVYRKRCMKRLQDGRARLIDRFRNTNCSTEKTKSGLVKEVMTEEWNMLKMEDDELLSSDSMNYNPFSSSKDNSDEDLNSILDIMEEIQKELMMEEQLMLSKYEDGIRFEEESLCAAIQCLQTDDVICPICKRYPLLQNKQVFFCSCGVRIDTEQDGITLEFVRNQLKWSLEQHSNEGCPHEPVFSVSSYPELGINNLIMGCQACDFLAVII